MAILAVSAYAQVGSHEFVSFDDPLYLFTYPQVREGLSLRTLEWAFGMTELSNWHPLTWISHAIDWQLFGSWAGGHHLTSLALHAASAILLFLALEHLSAARWPSAFVAAVFAVHPAHVESVAWVAERKDVLCGLFWMLSLYSYARFVESRSAASYASLLVAHALGLMSKPMGVTLPFVLLLLDYWPLGRLRVRGATARAVGRGPLETRPARALVIEKLPLFALSAVSSAITLAVQHEQDLRTLAEIPPDARLGNTIVGYAWYVAKTLWPARLAVLYLHPGHWPLTHVLGSLLALAAITSVVVLAIRRHPYLAVGWLWFIGALLPVIGIVQVGYHSFADRYSYLPSIGLSVMVAWGVPSLAARWRLGSRAVGWAAVAVVALLALATHAQVSVWRNTETLWKHAIEVTRDNHVAHANLGAWLRANGRVEEGLAHARRAARIASDDAHAHYNLGTLLLKEGYAAGAERSLRRALEIEPEHEEARINLGLVLEDLGRSAEAVEEIEGVLAAQPDHAYANQILGYLRELQGDPSSALRHYRRSLATEPGQPVALRRAARILATAREPDLRNADAAVRLAEQASRQREDSDPRDLDTLAAAYALAGRADEAVATARRAAELARRNRQPRLAAEIAKRAEAYAAGEIWLE